MENTEDLILKEALKNAVSYGGKANPKAVMGKIMKERPELRKHAKEIKPLVEKIVNEINGWAPEKQKEKLIEMDPDALKQPKKKEKEEKILPELPNAKVGDPNNPVVMRLAPYPSGALHIGNARMIVLNDYYVKRYKGRLILCYDDTIGTTLEKLKKDPDHAKYVLPEAYDLIKDGLDWLEVDYDKNNIIYKSDRVDIYKEYAEMFIKKSWAYVCDCEPTVFREKYKKTGKECPCRSLPIETHLERWEKMLDGTYPEGAAVVRLKTGMDLKDPAVRDHIIMRISDAEHPRIGNKTRVWPLLEFSWAIDDHLLGITHIIRGADLRKEGFIEKFIWDLMGWKHAEIILYGRLKFGKEFRLSKTEARVKIMRGEYDGWEDPRTWSLQSLRARGIHPEAVREALLELGLSIAGISFSEKWIYAKNTKIIDPIANRYWFVEHPVPLTITGLQRDEYIAEPYLHPNKPELGRRKVKLAAENGTATVYISEADIGEQISRSGEKIRYKAMEPGDRFRLKDLFTIELTEVSRDPPKLKAVFVTEKVDKDIRKIQWVPAGDNFPVRVLKPNGYVMEGYGESTVRGLKAGTILQFERYGYVRIKEVYPDYIYCYYAH